MVSTRLWIQRIPTMCAWMAKFDQPAVYFSIDILFWVVILLRKNAGFMVKTFKRNIVYNLFNPKFKSLPNISVSTAMHCKTVWIYCTFSVVTFTEIQQPNGHKTGN